MLRSKRTLSYFNWRLSRRPSFAIHALGDVFTECFKSCNACVRAIRQTFRVRKLPTHIHTRKLWTGSIHGLYNWISHCTLYLEIALPSPAATGHRFKGAKKRKYNRWGQEDDVGPVWRLHADFTAKSINGFPIQSNLFHGKEQAFGNSLFSITAPKYVFSP